jgi:hypothetical protein
VGDKLGRPAPKLNKRGEIVIDVCSSDLWVDHHEAMVGYCRTLEQYMSEARGAGIEVTFDAAVALDDYAGRTMLSIATETDLIHAFSKLDVRFELTIYGVGTSGEVEDALQNRHG